MYRKEFCPCHKWPLEVWSVDTRHHIQKNFFGRKPSATPLICIQRKCATFSTTGSPANSTRREEAPSLSAGLSLRATETAAARRRRTEDGESFNTLEWAGYHVHDLKRQWLVILMLAADAACTQQQGMSSRGHFVQAHPPGVTHQPSSPTGHLFRPGKWQWTLHVLFCFMAYRPCAHKRVLCELHSPTDYNALSHILKTEAQRVNDLPNIKVPEPDLEARWSTEVSTPRLLLLQMDTFFISHCLRHYVGEKEKIPAGKSSCTALFGGLYGSVSFLTRLIPSYPIKVGSWWK